MTYIEGNLDKYLINNGTNIHIYCEHLRSKLTELEHVDFLFNDQYNNERKRSANICLQHLWNLQSIPDLEMNSDGSQTGTLNIPFHHVTQCMSDT